SRRPEHDRVPRRSAEAGVGRQVIHSDVRLDLDDPADPGFDPVVAGVGIPDETGAEQGPGGLEGRARQERAVERGQCALKASTTDCGNSQPNSTKNAGMTFSRNADEKSESPMKSCSDRS